MDTEEKKIADIIEKHQDELDDLGVTPDFLIKYNMEIYSLFGMMDQIADEHDLEGMDIIIRLFARMAAKCGQVMNYRLTQIVSMMINNPGGSC